MKPLFFNKSISGDKTNLTEDGKHVKTEVKTTEVLNIMFPCCLKSKEQRKKRCKTKLKACEHFINTIKNLWKKHV